MNGLLTEAAAKTRDELIADHQGLVARIAKDFVGRGVPLEDLKQSGNLGLITAADRFDPARGLEFNTYARHWITSAVRREIVAASRPMRLPEWAWMAVGRYRKAALRLAANGGTEPEPAAVLAAIGAAEGHHDSILAAVAASQVTFDGGGVEWRAAVADDPADTLSDAEMLSRVGTAMGSLDAESRDLVTALFGLDGTDRVSLRGYARRAGIGVMRVSGLRDEVLSRLRSAILAPAPEPATKATPHLGNGRVDEVRRLLAAGVSQREAGRVLGVSLGTVSRINRGLSYANVPSREMGVAV